MPVHSDMSFKDDFLEGAAKAFFCTAYADFVEDDQRQDDGHEYTSPGCGGDWVDCLPPLPGYAYALAGSLWIALEQANKVSLYVIAQSCQAGNDLELFGHYLAMEAMGHGVSWWDDHEQNYDLKVPPMEVEAYSFDTEAYKGY